MKRFTARSFMLSFLIIQNGGLLSLVSMLTGTTTAIHSRQCGSCHIKYYALERQANQFDVVMAKFEQQTIDMLHLKLAAGEQVDLVFDAPWMNMNDFYRGGELCES
ncbi:hypothetical protein NST50_26455 [Paenibacillus sp. FSL E2-0202]|uniref:hypothetical protein n=1 Tax=Paenibacillus sp. FSL E2-0202 TaxID=2954505 RepID=UPI0030EDB14C